jgi:acyl-coenzyme A synthetase/AMP-(fatty) acid ligase
MASGWETKTWYQVFSEAASVASGVPALISYSESGESLVSLTYSQLLDKVDLLANVLAGKHAVKPHDVVGLCMERGPNFTALLLSCSSLGAQALPMPLEYPTHRLLSIMESVHVAIILFEDELRDELMQRAPCAKVAALEQHIAMPRSHWNTDPLVGGLILSSSGSTGVPKLIARSQASFYHRIGYTWETNPFVAGE